MSNMRVSDIIKIMQAIQKQEGDLEIVGECQDCGGKGMDIYILTADKTFEQKGDRKCWIEIAAP